MKLTLGLNEEAGAAVTREQPVKSFLGRKTAFTENVERMRDMDVNFTNVLLPPFSYKTVFLDRFPLLFTGVTFLKNYQL